MDNDRKVIGPQIEERLDQLHHERETWREEHHVKFDWDADRVHSDRFWEHRYSQWFDQTWTQPPVIEINQTVTWTPPVVEINQPVVINYTMPDVSEGWTYLDVGVVATNLELLTEQIYTTMDEVAPQSEYGIRLRTVLAQLEAAAALFSDDVNSTNDWSDTINDLFNLETATNLAVRTLGGYSQAVQVAPQMSALEQYVNELLYIYRMNY